MRLPPVFVTVFLSIGSLWAASPLKGRVIVVDAGHGVINYDGVIINTGKKTPAGVVEHKLNMEIASKLGDLLQKEGAKVYYTRTPTDYWREAYSAIEDNKARVAFANEIKAEAFIAIHCDWNESRKFSGVTTLYEKPDSRRLGEILQRHMVRSLKAKDRRLTHDSYTVLDNAEVPAVICETGFLSNRKESKKLVSTAYQAKVAKALMEGLKAYFAN